MGMHLKIAPRQKIYINSFFTKHFFSLSKVYMMYKSI